MKRKAVDYAETTDSPWPSTYELSAAWKTDEIAYARPVWLMAAGDSGCYDAGEVEGLCMMPASRRRKTMERPQIRKELFDLTLCIETLLHMIDKGSPLNSAEKEFIVRLADMLRDGAHGNRHAAASRYEKRASDSIGSAV